MKNQIRTLQSVLFVLLAVLGANAFTTPNQQESIEHFTEGKIQAAEHNYKASLVAEYMQAQQDFRKMNIDFDFVANSIEESFESLPQLSLISQTLYVYEQELQTTKFESLTLAERKSFISNLRNLKQEFYKTVSSVDTDN